MTESEIRDEIDVYQNRRRHRLDNKKTMAVEAYRNRRQQLLD